MDADFTLPAWIERERQPGNDKQGSRTVAQVPQMPLVAVVVVISHDNWGRENTGDKETSEKILHFSEPRYEAEAGRKDAVLCKRK